MRTAYVVDDHEIVSFGIKCLFQDTDDLRVAGTFTTEEELTGALTKEIPDLVILDLRLNGPSKFDHIRRVKQSHPTLPVLVVTMDTAAESATSCLMAGADGFVHKGDLKDEIVQAARAICDGKLYFKRQGFSLHRAVASEQSSSPRATLRATEYRVYCMLGRGIQDRDIAVELGITQSTLRTHRQNIVKRLGLSDMRALIRHATLHVATEFRSST